MSRSDPSILLREMRDRARQARSYVEAIDHDGFMASQLLRDASAMNLCVIGELAGTLLRKHVSVVADLSEIPWRDMQALRHRIVHGYDGVDWEVIWSTLSDDIPTLIAQLDDILDNGRQDGQG